MPRPRRSAPRTSSGRPSRAYRGPARDAGTREGQAKRLALVNGSGDGSLAYTLPDLLRAHGVLDRHQHGAAIRFRDLRARCFGVPLSVSDEGTEASDDRVAENEAAYARAVKRLAPAERAAVIDLALDLRPGWVRRQVLGIDLTERDRRDRRALLNGLDKLVGR